MFYNLACTIQIFKTEFKIKNSPKFSLTWLQFKQM